MNLDTIAAPATAQQPSGVAVIRVSGPAVTTVINTIFRSRISLLDHPKQFIYGTLIDPQSLDVVDRCLAVYFAAPNSFTGEDVLELHLHGSPLLVQLALEIIYKQGVRPAKAGEFTERAFLAGKLDLTQAEAIAEVINSSSKAALKIAQSHLSGRLSNLITSIGEPLKDCLAELEAHIDFPEEDIEPATLSELQTKIEVAQHEITKLLSSFDYGKKVKEGLKVLIYGLPNVGKSSLLNYLMREERAIVTPIAGTTRDILEEQINIGDLQFIFCDTAGINETDDHVEKIGIERAKARLSWADLVLFMLDVTQLKQDYADLINALNDEHLTNRVWVLINKVDQVESFTSVKQIEHLKWPTFQISALTGAGIPEVEEALVKFVQKENIDSSVSNVITSARHKQCLEQAQEALAATLVAFTTQQPLEIISAELRLALNALDQLIGRMSTEDLLGRIFSKFCIGK